VDNCYALGIAVENSQSHCNQRGSGEICMNGAAALKIKRGEEIIVMGFELTPAPITPTIILVDKANKLLRQL
jgi:aspartate 1-decarboxylase